MSVAADPDRRPLSRASGLGLGVAVLYLSALVLLPLAAIVARATGNGWSGFLDEVTKHQAVRALTLTLLSSVGVAVVNAVMGTLIAWVLVRDDFVGRRFVEVIIDIPFALPTIVAGVVLLSLYGTNSPVDITLLGTRRGVFFALLFVTVPYVVRTVQPVLEGLDREAEQAAASLGAGGWVQFRRIVFPAIVPAVAAGAALAFARAMGEYGSVLLLSGGANRATVSSMYAYQQIENFDYIGAATTATVLLAASLIVLVVIDVAQRRTASRG